MVKTRHRVGKPTYLKKFGGKTYEFYKSYATKREADEAASFSRKIGQLARRVKIEGRWDVYIRWK